jgi:hypothetical protein
MTSSSQPLPDPLIDEVRERRRKLYADCGNDIRALAKAIQQLEREHPEKVVDRRRTVRPAAPDGP